MKTFVVAMAVAAAATTTTTAVIIRTVDEGCLLAALPFIIIIVVFVAVIVCVCVWFVIVGFSRNNLLVGRGKLPGDCTTTALHFTLLCWKNKQTLFVVVKNDFCVCVCVCVVCELECVFLSTLPTGGG